MVKRVEITRKNLELTKIRFNHPLHWPNGLNVCQWLGRQGQVIPKTQKMVLDASLLNTQHYKVRIKGKVCTIFAINGMCEMDI